MSAALQQVHELLAAGRVEQARSAAMRVLAREPGNAEALSVMVTIAARLGDRVQALYYAERCARVLPRDVRAQVNLGRALLDAGRPEQAAAHLGGLAESLEPSERLYVVLASATAQLGRHAEALGWAERGLSLFPRSVELLLTATPVMLACGEAGRAVECCRRAREVDPRDPVACSNLLAALNYADLDVQAAAGEPAATYGRLVAERFGPAMFDWEVTPDPQRPLRVGLLSPDLRAHAVSYFAEPVLRHHDRAAWTLMVYSTANPEDDRSASLRGLVAGWRRLTGMRYVDAAEMIRRDRIDVLIDLAGHTNAHALPTMHLKPAPVQMTWIGYPHSTGVPSVDYRITDSMTDPPAERGGRWACVEKPLYMDPCFLVWAPPEGVPEPAAAPPCEAEGRVTFGAFAALQKLSNATVRMWARALEAAPGSRLLYKTTSLKSEGVRAMVMRRLEAAGVDPARVVLEPPGAGATEMMPQYARMDVSLDTFPYSGTTTTCECLWMGVPMVTLEGPAAGVGGGVPASRVSASIIRSAAGDEAERMIARSEEEYVEKAAALARDPARLQAWRSGGAGALRARMSGSALRDERGRCRQLEGLVRGCWRAWCAGLGERA